MRTVEVSRMFGANTRGCDWCNVPSKYRVEAIGVSGPIVSVTSCPYHLPEAVEFVSRAPTHRGVHYA